MAYLDPAPGDLATRFPSFAAVPAAMIQTVLDEAALRIDGTWEDADRWIAVLLYAAHVLTLDGQGTSNEAQLAGLRTIKVGSLSLERDTLTATTATDPLTSTSYGRRYLELCRVVFSGPQLI